MNLFNKKKKGFTIVELVIVIAVIGVLAAILIPTFVGLVNRANVAADGTLVRELNNAIALDLAEKGEEKHATMTDALAATEKNGFVVQRIKSKTNTNKILWDSVHGVFCYLKENAETVEYVPGSVEAGQELSAGDYRLWTISSTVDPTYSTYLYNYNGNGTVETSRGLDVGNEEVTSVTYKRTAGAAQEVVIRTNGGILTVNAPSDDVHHYGYAEKVDVVDVKATSYHENGEVDLIKVKKGHVELETEAQVLGVYVYNNSEGENKDTSFEEIKITVKGSEVPQLSRSAVQIDPTTGTKVCTVVTNEAKDIYLFQQGVYEQIKTVNEGKNVITDTSASWADDSTKNNDKTQTAAQQLANELNASFTVGETTYTVEVVDREVVVTNTTTNETVTDTTVVTKAVDQSGSSEDDAVADLPLKGDGLSWETAFEIYDYATMQKISDYFNVGKYFFKVAIEKTNNGHIDCSNWETVYLNGSFDGNGVILDNIDTYLFESNYETENSYILMKNFTANVNINVGDSSNRAAALLWDAANETYFDNITVHGYITSTYVAVFMGWTNAGINSNIYINDCYSDAELAGTDGSAVIFAHAWTSSSDDRYIYMTDTLYEGIMSGNYHTFVTACSGGGAKNKEMYVTFNDPSMLSRFRNVCIAILAENTNDNGYQYQWCPGTDILNQSGYGTYDTITGVMGMKNYVRTSAIEVIYHNGSDLTPGELVSIAKNASASTWSARFEIGPNDKNGYGNYVSAYVGPSGLTNNNGTLTTTNIYACTVTVNGDATESTGYTSDYTKFNVVNNIYGTTFGSASITITQYDSNGRLVQMDVWDLTK